ncbi:MAG: helix-turn-helix domain-containing protein [Actinomycetota bacterium]|nr:helix-turn-helix domain-containing protein [Actinomycetota bacterium]
MESVLTAPRPPKARLLTVDDAAERLNVSVRNVRHQIFTRRLPVVKIGRLVRIDERDLEALIDRGRSGGA